MVNRITKICISAALFVCVSFSISASKGNWSGLNLSLNELKSVINFQMLRGSTCITDFQNLNLVLDKFIANQYDLERLTEILGKPDVATTTNYYYYLTSSEKNCKAVLTVDANKLISYKIIDCK